MSIASDSSNIAHQTGKGFIKELERMKESDFWNRRNLTTPVKELPVTGLYNGGLFK